MTPQSKSDLHIAQPLTLKCGLTLPNRLVKASMTEGLADRKRHPTPALLNLYKHWADGGWGLVITGMHLPYLHHPDLELTSAPLLCMSTRFP
jgi:2,4-dienoyl-CoA reductase-like NADH-dependent reductase (Old Yellow Enzyme family)